jgi:hypothetical protein
MKHYVLLVALLCSGLAQAEMQVLSEDELQLVDGQGGADISLEMRLNMILMRNLQVVRILSFVGSL